MTVLKLTSVEYPNASVASPTGRLKAPSRLLGAQATGLVKPKPNRQRSLRAIGFPTTMPKKPPTALNRVPDSRSPMPLKVVLVTS